MNRGYQIPAGFRVPADTRIPVTPSPTCSANFTNSRKDGLAVKCLCVWHTRYAIWKGFLEILWRDSEPGILDTRGYPKTRGYPGTQAPVTRLPASSENPRVLRSGPTRQTGRTRPGIPAEYPGIRNQSLCLVVYCYPAVSVHLKWSKYSGRFTNTSGGPKFEVAVTLTPAFRPPLGLFRWRSGAVLRGAVICCAVLYDVMLCGSCCVVRPGCYPCTSYIAH